MTPAEIIAEFERRERAAGGYHSVDAKVVLQEMSRDLDIPYPELRDVMLTEWGNRAG